MSPGPSPRPRPRPRCRARPHPGRGAGVPRELSTDGVPDAIDAVDLITLPYPTRFGLWRAAASPAPFLAITNWMVIVRWTESDGRRRTLLFEPSDVELGTNTPYFAALAEKTPKLVADPLVTVHGDVLGRLAGAGIAPDEVDYVVFNHLHTQDMRRWLGTTVPQPDNSPERSLEPVFPNAKLAVQRSELQALAALHPLQQPWYQPETYRVLRPDALAPIQGDLVPGPSVALIATPGHTTGNQTLVLNTATGIWASSENAIAAACLTPPHSKIPSVARWARTWGQELVLSANTIERIAEQHNSLALEKAIVDVAPTDKRFVQFFLSSELTRR